MPTEPVSFGRQTFETWYEKLVDAQLLQIAHRFSFNMEVIVEHNSF
jgi:hypothetical protein